VKTNFKFDPAWLLQVIEETVAIDTYLQGQPEKVTFLKTKIPNCQLLYIRQNEDGFENNINLIFVDSINANQPGSDWQYKTSIKIEAVGADLHFEILTDDRIGEVEIWFHPESKELSKLYWLLKQ